MISISVDVQYQIFTTFAYGICFLRIISNVLISHFDFGSFQFRLLCLFYVFEIAISVTDIKFFSCFFHSKNRINQAARMYSCRQIDSEVFDHNNHWQNTRANI